MKTVMRVEKHVIKPSHPYYDLLDAYCFRAKNLYNVVNYELKQAYLAEKEARKQAEMAKEGIEATEGGANEVEATPVENASVENIKNEEQVEEVKVTQATKVSESTGDKEGSREPIQVTVFDNLTEEETEKLEDETALDTVQNKSSWYISRFDMRKHMVELECEDYYNLGAPHIANGIFAYVDQNWKSFFAASKDYKKFPHKYTGRPKPPKYLEKDGRYLLCLPKGTARIKDGYLHFHKSFNGLVIKTKCDNMQQVRVIPRNNHIVIEIVYKVEIDELKDDNGKYMAIDLGINNFATLVSNTGESPLLICGKTLKSINQFYNKQTSHYKSIAKTVNGVYTTKRIENITNKRNNRMSSAMHLMSKYVIDEAVRQDINTIFVGKNKDYKRGIDEGAVENQNIVGIPHQNFVNMLIYKGENKGIRVIEVDEEYTSGTSYLDNEEPTKANYNIDRRINRGIFQTNSGLYINADINAAYQILRKGVAKGVLGDMSKLPYKGKKVRLIK
jgi:putative transposase